MKIENMKDLCEICVFLARKCVLLGLSLRVRNLKSKNQKSYPKRLRYLIDDNFRVKTYYIIVDYEK